MINFLCGENFFSPQSITNFGLCQLQLIAFFALFTPSNFYPTCGEKKSGNYGLFLDSSKICIFDCCLWVRSILGNMSVMLRFNWIMQVSQ
jgi:hypothetical protein